MGFRNFLSFFWGRGGVWVLYLGVSGLGVAAFGVSGTKVLGLRLRPGTYMWTGVSAFLPTTMLCHGGGIIFHV